MLAALRLKSVRQALIVLMMVLGALMAFERVQGVINGVQHALAIEHEAPAFELAATAHDHHAHHHDDDRDAASDVATDQGDADPASTPHHHHAEGQQLSGLPAALTVELAVSGSDAGFTYAQSGSPQSRIFGLERPPKALGARA